MAVLIAVGECGSDCTWRARYRIDAVIERESFGYGGTYRLRWVWYGDVGRFVAVTDFNLQVGFRRVLPRPSGHTRQSRAIMSL